jgi:2-hydroxychromene-2-carboxylate isomerase
MNMLTIDYYLAPQSPYTYFGHARIFALASLYGARINLKPFDLGGKVFPVSGGVPLAQRPPQRQSYRLFELTRWAEHLQLPFNLKPKYFPVAGDEAARLIIRVDQEHGTDTAMKFAHQVMSAVWGQDLNIADLAVLHGLLLQSGLNSDQAQHLVDSRAQAQAQYDANSAEAIQAQVFGAPWFVIDGEPFWGQDRLDFVERKLAKLSGRPLPAQ